MKKLKIHEYAYPNPSPAGIGAKNTVSNGPDDGANNLLASHFWQAKRHGSTPGAVDNGLTMLQEIDGLSTGELNIGGHGNEGQVETGMGQTGPFDSGKLITTWNESSWGPDLDKIKASSVTQISIWSCHTGAGQDGANLLYAMAMRCGRAVRAGTGFLYSNVKETWWENGAVWQVATPTNKPAPINAPSQHSLMQDPLLFEVGGKEVPVADVKSMEITILHSNVKALTSKTLHGANAQSAVSSLFLPPALEMSAGVLAMVTANITLSFNDGCSAKFIVYNDRLAVDTDSQTGYYLAPSVQRLYSSLP